MATNLFREKNLKRIASPEELDSYIRVSRPSVWLVLTALIAILVGFCVWGIFGKLETTVDAQGVVEGGKMIAVLSSDERSQVEEGMPVYWDEQPVGTVEAVSVNEAGAFVAELSVGDLADGSYDLEILVESVHPLYFILN